MITTYDAVIHFNKLYTGFLDIEYSGQVSETRYLERGREYMHKWAYLDLDYPQRLVEEKLNYRCGRIPWHHEGLKLLVSKDCRTPRDLLRQNGYELTYKEERANYYILPDWDALVRTHLRYDIAVWDLTELSLYLYTVRRGNKEEACQFMGKPEYDAVCNWADYLHLEVLSKKISPHGVCSFIPKFEGYEKALCQDQTATFTFVNEKWLKVPATDISTETLLLWEKLPGDMLRKAIATSAWREYPFTICAFLERTHPWILDGADDWFRQIAKTIGFEGGHPSRNRGSSFPDRIIEPHDWNLMQKFIAAKLNVEKHGGYITAAEYANVTSYDRLIRKKVLVGPLYARRPMTFANLCNKIVEC